MSLSLFTRCSPFLTLALLVTVAACSGGDSDSTDTDETTSAIPVGSKPWSVALDEERGLLYGANEFDNTVSVVDLASGDVLAVVDSGTGPGAIGIDHATGLAYVANAFSNDVTVLEGTATVATITAGLQPWDIAVDTRSRRAYVANSGDGTITVIDTERNEVADTLIGLQEPWGVAVSADGSLYVADAATDELLHLSPDDGTILTRGRTGERPRGVALDEEAGRAYVANTETANVSVLSLSDLSPVATIEAGLAPLAVAVDPVRAQAYAVNSLSDDMTVIDTETATPVNTVDAGRKPWDLVVSEDGTVYVAASASGEILLFDASELTTAKSSP